MSEPESSKKRKDEHDIEDSVDQKRSFVLEKDDSSIDENDSVCSVSGLSSSHEDVSVEATRKRLDSNTVHSDTDPDSHTASSLGSGYDSDSEPEESSESENSKLKLKLKPTTKANTKINSPEKVTPVQDTSAHGAKQSSLEEEKKPNVTETIPTTKIFGTGFTSMSFGSVAAAPSPFSALSGKPTDDLAKGFSFLDQHASQSPEEIEPQIPNTSYSLSRSPEEIMTGEEDEMHIYQTRGKLYIMPLGDKKEWKERGVGLLHLNQSRHDQRRGRLVMRSEGTLKLILNAAIYATMKFEKIQDRHVRFVNVEHDQPCVYLLKLKNAAEANTLIQKVEQFKSKLIGLESKKDE